MMKAHKITFRVIDMTKLLLLIKPLLEFFKNKNGKSFVDYIKEKYDEATIKNVVLYGMLTIILLFVFTKLSGIIVWMTVGAVILVLGLKLCDKYFKKTP